MKTIALSTVVFALHAAPSSAAPPPSAWSFDVDASGAGPGSAIPYRLAWTNLSDGPVQIPAELLKYVQIKGQYEGNARRHAVAHLTCGTTPETAAPAMWQILAPGQAAQRIGTLSDFFDTCRDGCQPGNYTLDVTASGLPAPLNPRDPDAGPPAAVDPWDTRWTTTVPRHQLAPAIAVTAGPGLRATLTRIDGAAKTVKAKMRLVVTNHLTHAVYFPPAKALDVSWSGREVRGTGGSGWRQGRGGQTFEPWGPDTATLVGPGKTWTIVFDKADLNNDADHAWIALHLSLGGTFEPTKDAKTPFYFASGIHGLEAQLY